MNELLTIYQRWQASTPGEWITTAGSEGSLYENRIVCLQGEYTDADAKLIDLIDMSGVRDDCTAEDLLFIAEAHQDVPRLIDEIKRLRAQLAAVPVEAIRRQYTIGFHLYQSWLVDQDAILAWLRSLEPQP